MLEGLVGDASGVNSNGVVMLLSIVSKLERLDDDLVSDDGERVSVGKGMWKLEIASSVSGSGIGRLVTKRPKLSLCASIAELLSDLFFLTDRSAGVALDLCLDSEFLIS